jgi:EmrB/QacA subfamily drug resistance transporter
MTTLANISPRQKTSVMIGVALALLLFSLDQTIVSTAMPHIVSELHGLQHISWVFTAYMLASTVVVPVYGKLSDMFGRKPFLLAGIFVFLLGSILSGAAHSMGQLIAFRAIQGLGGGAMMANAFAVVADLFPPAERGKWQGVLGGIFGLSSVAGPLLGGFLTDHASWRWNFYINIPIGLAALAVIWYLMPRIIPAGRRGRIDILGSVLLTGGLVNLLLGLVWGGTQYAWGSWQTISLLGSAAALIAAFLYAEHRAEEPILPLSLFKNRTFSVSMFIVFIMGMAMFGVILYIPLFAQGVIGTNATSSGTILTPLMLGLISASIVSGRIISKTGRYKALAVLGLIIAIGSMYWLSTMGAGTTRHELVYRMITMGLGLGITMPIFNIAVQNAFDRTKIGVVTASSQLFRGLGSTVGTAVLGTVFNNVLAHKAAVLGTTAFAAFTASAGVQTFTSPDPNTIQGVLSAAGQSKILAGFGALPVNAQIIVHDAFNEYVTITRGVYAGSITFIFLVGAGLSLVALLASFALQEVPLRRTNEASHELEEAGLELAAGEAVIPAKDEPELGVKATR